ncbi:hypothetical protein SPRG_06104 [Saprolegnia parasitica CBS 223.65]|uniref:Uncharacterized protein n=1 Tax=Saprolegnia parasitica (strain CBS 223.65) TaxID=695850 RepID=A0A067CE64_SAPPC|nr:hypothetical protein SPRG_06104 [Saprolegnia parasitica CBS 223.65]KDO29049.1 hypothetical protein SPRG_06104 [Saprolegnia parasitica CBS 223.65]|eukprot:XP_012200219.1 hypothetical protein SPRG_06104 [Saprolegnia parasitica CBS 223.65]
MQLLGLYSLFSALGYVDARLNAWTPTACDIFTSGYQFTLFNKKFGYWNFDEPSSGLGLADEEPDGTFWLKVGDTHHLAPNPDATAYFFRTVTIVSDEAAVDSTFGPVLSNRRWSCRPMGPGTVALIDYNGYSPKPTPYHSESDSPWPYLISAPVDVLLGPSPDQTFMIDRYA